MGVAYSLGQGCKKCNVSVDLLLYCFYACVTCILVHFFKLQPLVSPLVLMR